MACARCAFSTIRCREQVSAARASTTAAARRVPRRRVRRVRGQRRRSRAAQPHVRGARFHAGRPSRAQRTSRAGISTASISSSTASRRASRARTTACTAPRSVRSVSASTTCRPPCSGRRHLQIGSFSQPVGPGELRIPSVRGVGGSLLYFMQAGRRSNGSGIMSSSPKPRPSRTQMRA